MTLDKRIIEEAGPWQQIIAPLFDEIMLGNPTRMGEAEIILDIFKKTKSPDCYRAYSHLYNNILTISSMTKELRSRC